MVGLLICPGDLQVLHQPALQVVQTLDRNTVLSLPHRELPELLMQLRHLGT